MIKSFVNGMLMELHWLNIMLVIVCMVKLVVSLVISMIGDSLMMDWYFMVHCMMEDWSFVLNCKFMAISQVRLFVMD